MNRRIKSIDLMQGLQPFTQIGLLKADEARQIVKDYVGGSNKSLLNFILNPHIPAQYMQLINNLRNYAD